MHLKMKTMRKIFEKRTLGLSFLGLSLAGCLSATPHFYGLSQKPMPVVEEKEAIGPIKVFLPFIPLSIDRDVMVRRVGKYELTLSNASWSEPLSAQIAGTFTKDLGQALPKELVFEQNNMVAEKPKVGIDLTVNSFSLDEKGYAIIDGLTSFTLHDDSGKRVSAKTRHFSWKSEKYADKGPQVEIDALSEGLAAWAADTASFVTKGAFDHEVAEADSLQTQNEKEADEAEKEMRQAQMIASADAAFAQEQKKMKQAKKSK